MSTAGVLGAGLDAAGVGELAVELVAGVLAAVVLLLLLPQLVSRARAIGPTAASTNRFMLPPRRVFRTGRRT
jgi:hypothetical protein